MAVTVTNMTGSERLPFRLRLKAWWEGYDPAELAARLARAAPAPMPEPAPPATPAGIAAPAPAAHDPWTAARTEIAQFIWGEGYCGPGGPGQIVGMCKLLALSEEMSLLEIGAGLGGPARALAEQFGTWVTGYEASAELAARAEDLSVRAGLARKAVVHAYDPAAVADFERSFDRALAKEALVHIEDKARLLGLIEERLKASGLFLITDYVLGEDGEADADAVAQWRAEEAVRQPFYPVTAESLTALVKQAGFAVRVDEDITGTYRDLIAAAWKGADRAAAELAARDDAAALLHTLLTEGEVWARRVHMMDAGALKVRRILASKRLDRA